MKKETVNSRPDPHIHIHLNKEDQLRWDILSGFAVKSVKNISVDHRTHRHKAKFFKTKKYAFIKIDRSYDTLKNLLLNDT